MKPQRVVAGTPYTDQMYSAVTANWLNIRPMPERWLSAIGSYLPEAHNGLVKQFLEETDADRLVIIEDDLALRPNIFARCRTHQADVVTGLYVARRPPYNPLAYEDLDEESGACFAIQPARMSELLATPREHPIESCGTGILSVHRRVLEAIPWPWFEASPAALEGQGFGGHDFMFCAKVKRAGFRLALDSAESMYGYHVGWQGYDMSDYIDYFKRNPSTMVTSG